MGLVGDFVFANATLPPDTLVVSLETRRTLPGAVQGEGPVIRVGDRATTFTDEAEWLLRQAAERLQKYAGPQGSVKIQRQLMSGGRCEGQRRCGGATRPRAWPSRSLTIITWVRTPRSCRRISTRKIS